MSVPKGRVSATRIYRVPGVEPTPQVRNRHSKQYHAMKPVEPGTLGAVIRDRRLEKGWTQGHLAELAHLRQAQISAYERGEIKRPDPDALYALDAALGFEHGHLLSLAGWKGARHVSELVPRPGAIVIEDASPELEHVIDILARLEPETLQRIADSATAEYRTETADAATDNEAQASDHLTIVK